ncbi:UDP-2,4-diacetamido-2,4,6-trideoxy-beta-L-altropyranose hydrolase [Gorillibacterium massiliense]|uniref:UDP-2,4-diacetamido-2,4, 6-trideoxy-beta-L-altropyranose hydrolase n=1 Tax=Gorillibacterium massiliense TaxID=1280390 RepID=UPI0004B12FC1|nr:UDP-2,4-diacetamido-2,4,6-trideoxy-beta-L-altropyranose hydrolase [Gorillibacterium massiliense]
MKFFIRTDASALIGTGHIMRCLTLANQLKRYNYEVTILYRQMPSHFIQTFDENGFSSIHLMNNDPLGSSLDALYVTKIIQMHSEISKSDWLIVDHYGIDWVWEAEFEGVFGSILVIDDLANRKHQCTLLLDANLYQNYESRYNHLLHCTAKQLLGPKYALLREEFLIERNKETNRDEEGSLHLLVCFGGTDPTNETLKVLHALQPLLEDTNKLKVKVILGQANPNISVIQSKCHMLKNTKLLIQPASMAREMATSDLAICGGGTMTWERYCMGLPAITIAIADNQVELAKEGQGQGIDLYLGESQAVTEEDIRSCFINLFNGVEHFRNASKLAMELVDGRGAERVTQLLLLEQRGSQ